MAKDSQLNYLDQKSQILDGIRKNGGWVNTHAHIDRAYSLTQKRLGLTDSKLQEKWQLVDEMKRASTVSQIYDRMAKAVETMLAQHVQAIGTFIDVDEVIEDKAIQAAQKIRDHYKRDIRIVYINQVLKGVLDKKAKYWFDTGSEFVDIIGGLPGKDKGREQEHIDILLDTAKRQNKMVHVHVDQFNSPNETETELLIKRTKKYGMQGKVVAIHGISVAAHKKAYRQKLYKQMKEAQVMLVCCPSAWLDSRRTEILSVTHNAIAPVEELMQYGITVSLGTDNIIDIYKPFSDGDLWVELRFLIESCHYYDKEKLVSIATINGLKTLGLA